MLTKCCVLLLFHSLELSDDNARSHRAKVVTDYRRREGMRTLNWSDMSHDMPPMSQSLGCSRADANVAQLGGSYSFGIAGNTKGNHTQIHQQCTIKVLCCDIDLHTVYRHLSSLHIHCSSVPFVLSVVYMYLYTPTTSKFRCLL